MKQLMGPLKWLYMVRILKVPCSNTIKCALHAQHGCRLVHGYWVNMFTTPKAHAQTCAMR